MSAIEELKGAGKKEAFHRAAESNTHAFSFAVPDIEAPSGRINCSLAKTDSCSATILVIRKGYKTPHHYHPNQEGIWLVLKGCVRFYSGEYDNPSGEFGPLEGILQPENSRYWFETAGDEEAWLLQIAGYPKGKDKARRIAVDKDRAPSEGGVRADMAIRAAQ